MTELPRQKKSLDDILLSPEQGIHHGILQDAKTIWNQMFFAAATLNDPDEMETMGQEELGKMHEVLMRPLRTYREYLDEGFTSDAAEDIMKGSSREKVEQHDALVGEFNSFVEGGFVDQERALALYEQAMELFGE